jgi:hypothetical protein
MRNSPEGPKNLRQSKKNIGRRPVTKMKISVLVPGQIFDHYARLFGGTK